MPDPLSSGAELVLRRPDVRHLLGGISRGEWVLERGVRGSVRMHLLALPCERCDGAGKQRRAASGGTELPTPRRIALARGK